MSTPMYDTPTHFPMPINSEGEGPETDASKVVRTVCWSCIPAEDWPCEASRKVLHKDELPMLIGLLMDRAGMQAFEFKVGEFLTMAGDISLELLDHREGLYRVTRKR